MGCKGLWVFVLVLVFHFVLFFVRVNYTNDMAAKGVFFFSATKYAEEWAIGNE